MLAIRYLHEVRLRKLSCAHDADSTREGLHGYVGSLRYRWGQYSLVLILIRLDRTMHVVEPIQVDVVEVW